MNFADITVGGISLTAILLFAGRYLAIPLIKKWQTQRQQLQEAKAPDAAVQFSVYTKAGMDAMMASVAELRVQVAELRDEAKQAHLEAVAAAEKADAAGRRADESDKQERRNRRRIEQLERILRAHDIPVPPMEED